MITSPPLAAADGDAVSNKYVDSSADVDQFLKKNSSCGYDVTFVSSGSSTIADQTRFPTCGLRVDSDGK